MSAEAIKADKLETQRVIIETLLTQLKKAIGDIEDFPSDFTAQVDWRYNLEDIIFHLEMEMSIYKRIELDKDT
jgi:hypothetical protein